MAMVRKMMNEEVAGLSDSGLQLWVTTLTSMENNPSTHYGQYEVERVDSIRRPSLEQVRAELARRGLS